jgi:hypothetical protein
MVTRQQGRDEAIGESTSTGDASRASPNLNQHSPSTNAEGKSRLIHSPNFLISHSCHCLQDKTRREQLVVAEVMPTQPPEQKPATPDSTSTSSPAMPEKSDTGTRTSPEGLIPTRRRRCHRLTADAGEHYPRSTRTGNSTPPADRRGRSSPRYLPTTLRPSEAEGTAGLAGSDRVAPFRPSQL